MPAPTPFHECTSPLCTSFEWRDWAGYLAAGMYEPTHEREYYALRNSVGLIDISPLFKYDVRGPDAQRLVDRVLTRDATRCRVGQVIYSPWCNEQGKVIDDGTIMRFAEDHFRITAADPSLRWFQDVGYGLRAEVVDVSAALAALALQGPRSRDLLQETVRGIEFDRLRYFRLAQGTIAGCPVTVTRTGYTGDLGYELWLRPEDAERIWTVLAERGKKYGLLPAGMVALDLTRIEAGYLLVEVDYISADRAVIPAQLSSPYELGLGWAVHLDGANFIGKRALVAERARGSKWQFVGLQVRWDELQAAYAAEELPPQVAGRASRSAVPVYEVGSRGRTQIGQLTSHAFSPICKQYIGLGTLLTAYAEPGAVVEVEITVEYSRQLAAATVVQTPFYEPAHKKA